MSEVIDLARAETVLAEAWSDIGTSSRPPEKMQGVIESVMSASDVTFKYILVTGYLAKCVNRKVHARALQTGSELRGAYDARSLCHKVIVGFEKKKGNLFGLSNEPFVNKPARHPEHDGANPQLRNKAVAGELHIALELAQTSNAEEVYLGLVHVLRLGFQNLKNVAEAEVANRINLSQVVGFVKEFLQRSDGGARLVAVWGAFSSLLNEDGEVRVYSPNASDLYAKTVGDVEVYYGGSLASASECKQRAMNLDDVLHGIRKAVQKGVPEYNFVISAGILDRQETLIQKAFKDHAREIDLSVIDVWQELPILAEMLNPVRRSRFGEMVVKLLREMRKFESANAAAEIWNKLQAEV
jgi:hypothetical protein